MNMKRMLVFTGFFYFFCLATATHAGMGFLKIFIAKTHPSCEQALPPSNAKFCRTFETAARCACSSSGVPASLCHNMNSLHERMITVFSTQLAACQFQKDTSVQNCLDSWKCYREGGKDSKGRLCQATGAACTHHTA